MTTTTKRPRVRIRVTRQKQKARLGYVMLPSALVRSPPICSARDYAKGSWTPFDMAVVCALLQLATENWIEQRHASALQSGQQNLQSERDQLHTAKKIKKFAKRAYSKARDVLLRSGPLSPIAVRISSWQLLKRAGLYPSSRNVAALRMSLKRLSAPVQVGTEEWPALISHRDATPRGFTIQIDPRYLTPPLQRVTTPLPAGINTHLALTLYLIQHQFYQRGSHVTDRNSLLRRMRIEGREPARALRTFDAAETMVNRHRRFLHRLISHIEDDALRADWLDKVPISVRARKQDDDKGPMKLRFLMTFVAADDDEHQRPSQADYQASFDQDLERLRSEIKQSIKTRPKAKGVESYEDRQARLRAL